MTLLITSFLSFVNAVESYQRKKQQNTSCGLMNLIYLLFRVKLGFTSLKRIIVVGVMFLSWPGMRIIQVNLLWLVGAEKNAVFEVQCFNRGVITKSLTSSNETLLSIPVFVVAEYEKSRSRDGVVWSGLLNALRKVQRFYSTRHNEVGAYVSGWLPILLCYLCRQPIFYYFGSIM